MSCKGTYDAIPSALAIELFHCSTLIMMITIWMMIYVEENPLVTYNLEANAVLAGDALIIEAFNLIVKSQPN